MVHRKSEYRLQYHFLPENIRKQIWEDNVNLRSCRKVVNQAHHYWEYQITDADGCDCDGEDEYDPGPPPPHKLKHKTLLERYGNKSLSKSTSCVNFDQQSKIREIAVQTPNWKGRKHNSGSDSGRASSSSEELQQVMRNMSSLSLPEVPQNGSGDSNRPSSPVPPESPMAVVGTEVPRFRSRSHSRPSSVAHQRTPPPRSRTPCPTRTTQKLYTEGKRTHFVPFGWNNAETQIGKKKTFNVCAPKKEVHQPAVDASKRKHEEIQKFISEDLAKNRHRFRSPYPTGNLSSIWMSEYKEKFCKQRPMSAPPPPS